MRAFPLLIIAALTSLFLTACSGVETRPSDTKDFVAGNYHFYSWRSEPIVNSTNSRDPMYRLDPILRDAINTSLQSKGYVLDAQRAQFSVDYIFAEGVRDGVKGEAASNLSTHPGVVPDRNLDQASIDNAHALGSLKETRNIGIQLNDIGRTEEVWRVVITKLVEDANTTPNDSLRKSVNSAVAQGMRTLPDAR
jgi:predicted secreted protein